MGAVFRAYDSQSPQQPWVALKVVQLKGDVVARRALEDAFRREGSAAAMLSEHQNYFVGFRGSDFAEPAYLALEFVEWPTLKTMRQEAGTLPPLDVAQLGIEILRGVRWMERRRMVHRDLKPDNIFACRTTTGFRAKIADLGVWIDSGEAADTSLFGTGESMRLAGTPAYMSPEQMRGEALTSSSDLHMVASVLWELTTGSVPYPMRPGALMDALRERGERTRVSRERPPNMPEGLYRILTTALRFDPRERTFAESAGDQSAAGVAEASPVRGMEKALEKFVAEYAQQRKEASLEAQERLRNVETSVANLRATLIRAAAFTERLSNIHREIQTIHQSLAEPELLNAEARRLTEVVDRLRDEATEAFSDVSAKAALVEAHKEVGRERARAEAERTRAEEAERQLTRSKTRSMTLGVATTSAALAVGLIGLVIGILGLARRSSPHSAATDGIPSTSSTDEGSATGRFFTSPSPVASPAGSIVATSSSSGPVDTATSTGLVNAAGAVSAIPADTAAKSERLPGTNSQAIGKKPGVEAGVETPLQPPARATAPTPASTGLDISDKNNDR